MSFRELRECINLQYGSLHLAFTQWDKSRHSELTRARLLAGMRHLSEANPAQVEEFADSLFAHTSGCTSEAVDFNLFFLHLHKGEQTHPASPGRRRRPSLSSPAKSPGTLVKTPSPQSIATPSRSPPTVIATPTSTSTSTRGNLDRLKLHLLACEWRSTVCPSDVRRGLHLVDLTMPLGDVERIAQALLGNGRDGSSSARQPTNQVLSRVDFLQHQGLLYND